MSGWIVKFEGPCSKCGTLLHAGEVAVWDHQARRMSCVVCPPAGDAPSPAPLDGGIAGASARQEEARRLAKREAELKARWGARVGGLITRLADEPQSIRAWGIGARGEELLGKALGAVPGLVVLNDRRVQGTKGNIDHILIAPAGVFVVDAKHYQSRIDVVDRGGFFRTDLRLTIGGRDRSHLAENMDWQVRAVIRALTGAGIEPLPHVTAVLCFVEGDWPLFRRPKTFSGVLLESERSIVERLTATSELDEAGVERIAAALAAALPSK
jgi:hypothetical protein